MSITARYVDTCLSDYLQSSYSGPGQFLCLTPTGLSLDEAVDSLYDSVACTDAGIPEHISDEQIRAAFRDALQGVDLRWIDENGNRCDETPEEGHDGDEPYIYVVLEWDATVVDLHLVVDVSYYLNGADPHDLKTVLENLIRFAASDGALQGGTDAVVKSWGATALTGKSSYIK